MRHLISLAFLFAITFNVYGQVPDYVPSDGLVAWYPFNGNANDESGNGNDGVVNGALLVPDRNGNQSSAYGFDGLNAQISLPDLPSPTTYTLSAWATKLAGDYDTRYILSDFGTGESGGPEGIALLKNNTGIYSHTAGLGGDGACFSGENIVDDQWNHIVVIRNSANVSFWINGELISTDACITPDPIDRLGLAFIGSGVTSQQHWKGNIDDVGFWNRALSASEITSLFNAPSPIQGCTDETACNYDDEATNDDSSCEYNITPVDLGEDITTCDASVTLDAGEGYVSYLWSNGETTQSIEVSESGDYSIEVGNGDVSSSSLSFDGENDYVRINEGSDFFGSTGDFTAACWLKLDDNVQGVAEPIFESNIQNELQLMIVNNDGRLTCNAGGGLIAESIALVWDTNTWYHVAISNLSGHLKFYRNGIELGYSQEPYSGNINTRSFSSLNIGKDDDEDDPYSVWLDGSISDFVYWDIALSAFEVNNYITCPPMGDELGLVGYWRFNEGAGNFAQDFYVVNADVIGATWSSEVPDLACQIISCSSSDNITVTIHQPTISYTDITACDSYDWNGTTYSESGTYSTNVSSNSNYSMNFDGVDDYVDCGSIPLSGQEFSFMSWVKLNSTPPNGIIGNVFRNHWGDGNWLRFIGTKPSFNINTNMPVQGEMESQTSLNANQWYHITCTYDGSAMKLYLDGILDIQRAYTGVLTTYSSLADNFYFGSGKTGNSFSEFLDGNIGNASLWTQVLTENDIQNYMNCPPTGTESGLVGYWNFEEGQGTTAYDQTPNVNDGTINGATYDTNVPIQSCDLTNINGCDSTAVLNLTMLPCDAVSTFCGEGTVWDANAQECIVANPTDTNFDGCTDLNDLLDILSAYGGCSVAGFACGDDIEHEGYLYSTVQIGDQCWFSENCRYLPEVSPSSEGSETEPYYYVYDYQGTDIEEAQATANYATYGVLYNWPAVMTEGICPSNWHIPSDGEFTQLTDYLGGEAVAGDAMKSTLGWSNNGNGSNSSGFQGLPGGIVSGNIFVHYLNDAYFWSSTSEGDSFAWYRNLFYQNSIVDRNYYLKSLGRSTRCIKD